MENIPIGVFILLGIFLVGWIFTRNNIANFLLWFPMVGICVYIILQSTDTWIDISCEVWIIGSLIISLVRMMKRA